MRFSLQVEALSTGVLVIPASHWGGVLFPQAEVLLSIYAAGVVALGCQVESLQI